MAIVGLNESSLATSEIFSGLNKLGGVNQKERAVRLIKTAKHLRNEDIEGAYIQVKQYSNSLSRAAVQAFDSEKIVLIYNNVPKLSVSQALPFITFKTAKGYVTYVFVDKYVKMNKDNVLTMQAPILHDLLVSAFIANSLKTNYNALASNQFLQKILMEIYTKLICRILNREYSIAGERIISETIQYWVNKFFLIRVFGSLDDLENLETVASKKFKYLSEMDLELIKAKYDEADPIKISELLTLIKTTSPRMRTLSLEIFLSNWINYYYPPSMFAIDTMEYLIFMILSLLSGNNIISITSSEVVKETKGIKTLKEELFKLT